MLTARLLTVSQHALRRGQGCVSQHALGRGCVYPSMHWVGLSAQGKVSARGVSAWWVSARGVCV